MPTVVVLGTLDTKGHEYAYLIERVREQGVDCVLVDTGVFEPQVEPDVSRQEVATAAGADVDALAAAGDRGVAVSAMAEGAAAVARRLHAEGRLDGIASIGGSGNSSIAGAAMRALPVGVPKLIVSTVASGDTRPYMGASDVTMTYSVVDIAGINQISARILTNAAGAIAGMVKAQMPPLAETKPLVTASMFGVTTPSVTRARERLEVLGYEVLVFHQTGTGGESMEELMRAGFITGSLDVTTTELADELVGGVLAAYPRRLEAAGELGLPQVVSLGALDMVNFGPRESVPERFAGRNLYVHNPTITLMRTTPDECRELGRRIGRKLSGARGPTALFVPLRGVSMIATEGQPFHDPEADAALLEGLRETLGDNVEVHELDLDVNDEQFALAMADRLDEMIRLRRDRGEGGFENEQGKYKRPDYVVGSTDPNEKLPERLECAKPFVIYSGNVCRVDACEGYGGAKDSANDCCKEAEKAARAAAAKIGCPEECSPLKVTEIWRGWDCSFDTGLKKHYARCGVELQVVCPVTA